MLQPNERCTPHAACYDEEQQQDKHLTIWYVLWKRVKSKWFRKYHFPSDTMEIFLYLWVVICQFYCWFSVMWVLVIRTDGLHVGHRKRFEKKKCGFFSKMLVIHSATKEKVEKPNKRSRMKEGQVTRLGRSIKHKYAILKNKIDALRTDNDTKFQQIGAQFQRIETELLQMRRENATQR